MYMYIIFSAYNVITPVSLINPTPFVQTAETEAPLSCLPLALNLSLRWRRRRPPSLPCLPHKPYPFRLPVQPTELSLPCLPLSLRRRRPPSLPCLPHEPYPFRLPVQPTEHPSVPCLPLSLNISLRRRRRRRRMSPFLTQALRRDSALYSLALSRQCHRSFSRRCRCR